MRKREEVQLAGFPAWANFCGPGCLTQGTLKKGATCEGGHRQDVDASTGDVESEVLGRCTGDES